MEDDHAYIVEGCRTPIGKLGGILSSVRADDLAAIVIKSLLERVPSFDPALIDDVIMGCANQAGEDNRNIARMALLLAGLPVSVPGETVNRLCASGMSAIVQAYRAIRAGEGNCFIAGGVEHMTRSPWVISKTQTPFGREAQMFDSSFGWRFINPEMKAMYGTEAMGETAENLAELYDISRLRQDQFSAWSQEKTSQAMENGRLSKEIIPVTVQLNKKQSLTCSQDEFPRPDTTVEALSGLRTAFRQNGTVTAGNSSGLNDGAASLLIASGHFINQHKLTPLARIVSSGVSGVEPRCMGIGPVTASLLALSRAGLNMEDIDIIELNEAFAAQVLACLNEWKLADDDSRINPNGGAIALGHPLGMSGARIVYSAALELHLTGKRYALCTMCIGVGQGYAVVLENPAFDIQ
ncbi:MAG TPA: acetyl-CoA C-acyltransferase [Saprospiraceae bacterium]|nr:acetyl-CoA C-acyltransferase [Saprospiraceae bacterium]